MTPAELARRNAIPLELKKDGLAQRQSGDWVLRFVVQASEMDERLMKAAMGTRFQAALVEISDDETPVQQPTKELPASEPHSGRARWRELQPAAQAGIRCADPIFRVFLKEEFGFDAKDQNAAAIVVRQLCAVSSRRELNVIPVNWNALDDKFLAWKYVDA